MAFPPSTMRQQRQCPYIIGLAMVASLLLFAAVCMASVLPTAPILLSTSNSDTMDDAASGRGISRLGSQRLPSTANGGVVDIGRAVNEMRGEIAMNKLVARLAQSERMNGGSGSGDGDSDIGDEDVVRGKTALLLSVVRGLRAAQDALKSARNQLLQFVMSDDNAQSQIRQLFSTASNDAANINIDNNNARQSLLTTQPSSTGQLKRFVRSSSSAMSPDSSAQAAWLTYPSAMRQLAAAQHAWQAKRFGGQEFLGKRFAGQEFLG